MSNNVVRLHCVGIVVSPAPVPNDSGDRFAFIRDNARMLVELVQPTG